MDYDNMDNSAWISVSDKLPEYEQFVLTFCKSKIDSARNYIDVYQFSRNATTPWVDKKLRESECFERFDGDEVTFYSKDQDGTFNDAFAPIQYEITHWMPLPSPPQIP